MPVAPIAHGFKPTPLAQGIAIAFRRITPLCTIALPFAHELSLAKPVHHTGDPRPTTLFDRRRK